MNKCCILCYLEDEVKINSERHTRRVSERLKNGLNLLLGVVAGVTVADAVLGCAQSMVTGVFPN